MKSKISERNPYGGCRYSRKKEGKFCWIRKNRGNDCGFEDPADCSIYQRNRKQQTAIFYFGVGVIITMFIVMFLISGF